MSRSRADSPPLFPDSPATADFSRERTLIAEGHGPVAGIDEAGRGPLAGPVVAAAVILDPARIPAGLADSKTLGAPERLRLHDAILAAALAVSVAAVNADSIDATDILAATMLAMRKAALGLALEPRHLIIDGNRLPAGLPCPAVALVRGDALSQSVAAASIIAKVTRDRMMETAATAHPAYGFERHKGYGGAARHREAIAALGGVARLHRFTFAPLRHSVGTA